MSNLKNHLKNTMSMTLLLIGPYYVSQLNQPQDCGNGILLSDIAIIYSGKFYSKENYNFSCSNSGIEEKTGLHFIYNTIGNANEDTIYFYFNQRRLVWKTSAIVLGSSKKYYVFGDKNRDEPLNYVNLYLIEKETWARKLKKYEILNREDCGEIQFVGLQRTSISKNSILTVSRVDECGEFETEFKINLD